MQIIFYDISVRSNTVQDLKELSPQSLATEAKEGKQLLSMMPAIRKSFEFLGADIGELSTDNKSLKKTSFDDGKWLEESK